MAEKYKYNYYEEHTAPTSSRAEVARDNYGRYLLPDPETGVLDSYTRATTLSSRFESRFTLEEWSERNLAVSVLRSAMAYRANPKDENNPYPRLAKLVKEHDTGQYPGTDREWKKEVKNTADEYKKLAGASAGADFGTAIHGWTEEVDSGRLTVEEVPEKYRPYVQAYVDRLAELGIIPVPEWIERIVRNDMTETAGTFDRIYMLKDGSLVIGDIKTGAYSIYNSVLSYGAQQCQYAHAKSMYNPVTDSYEPMPKVRTDIALIVSIPRQEDVTKKPYCEVYTIDLAIATEIMYHIIEADHLARGKGTRSAMYTALHNSDEINPPTYRSYNQIARDSLTHSLATAPVFQVADDEASDEASESVISVAPATPSGAAESFPPTIADEAPSALSDALIWEELCQRATLVDSSLTVPGVETPTDKIIYSILSVTENHNEVRVAVGVLPTYPQWAEDSRKYSQWANTRAQSFVNS